LTVLTADGDLMPEVLIVGKPHPSLRPPVPAGAFFNWSAGGLELLLSLDRPTAREVEAARAGGCEFALAPFGPALFLAYRFGEALPWSDAPYTPHLLAEDRRPDPEQFVREGQRLILQIVLVESRSAVVRVLRAVSFSPDFSRSLAEAMRGQLLAPWPGRAEYDRQLAAAYAHWPDSADMLGAALARCEGEA
jgi:hypothetical protein